MPVRFTSPSLGALGGTSLNDGQWEVGVVYRYLYAHQFYVGRDYLPARAPGGGMPVRIHVNTVELTLTWAATGRLGLHLGVPLATGHETRAQGDTLLHTASAAGVGDLSLVGTAWVLNPQDHPRGNLAFGLGVKAPTGQSAKRASFVVRPGTVQQRSVDPSIQLGDGGWGIIVEAEAFREIARRIAAYAAGSYLANPKAHNGGTFTFGPAYRGLVAPMAVPDEYSAHAGLTWAASARRGLAMSLGWRIDGVPVHDLVGGGDDAFRRPGYEAYMEPGLSLTLGRSPLSPAGTTLTLNVPVAYDQNRRPNAIDLAYGQRGGGDFARFLIFLGASRRF
jgi:hypothetical protein